MTYLGSKAGWSWFVWQQNVWLLSSWHNFLSWRNSAVWNWECVYLVYTYLQLCWAWGESSRYITIISNYKIHILHSNDDMSLVLLLVYKNHRNLNLMSSTCHCVWIIWRCGDLASTKTVSSPDVTFQEAVIYFLFLVDVAYKILTSQHKMIHNCS